MRGILVGVLALVAAACAPPDDHGPRASPTGTDQAMAVMRELAACIRRHGAPDFPDPVRNKDGLITLPGDAPEPPASAKAACEPIMARIPPGTVEGGPVTAAQMQALMRFARCMREQGLADWPDPDPNGAFPLPERLRQAGKRLMGEPLRACEKHNPVPGGGVKVSEEES